MTTPELDPVGPVGRGRVSPRVAMEHERLLETPSGASSPWTSHGTGHPYLIKQLPGRKTDVRDAEWIATLLAKELVRGKLRAGRDTIRVAAVRETTAPSQPADRTAESQMDNQMQACNIRLSNHVSDIGGSPTTKVVQALIEGDEAGGAAETHTREDRQQVRKRHADRRPDWIRHRGGPRHVALYMEGVPTLREAKGECKSMGHMPGALQGTERTPGDHTGVAHQARCASSARPVTTWPPSLPASALVGWAGLRPRNQMSAGKIRDGRSRTEPFPEDRAGAVRMGRGRVPGTGFALK